MDKRICLPPPPLLLLPSPPPPGSNAVRDAMRKLEQLITSVLLCRCLHFLWLNVLFISLCWRFGHVIRVGYRPLFPALMPVISEQFQSNYREGSVQFQSNYGAVSQTGFKTAVTVISMQLWWWAFRAISVQLQCRLRVASVQFQRYTFAEMSPSAILER